MSIRSWLKNFIHLKIRSIKKLPYPMAKEADLRSPIKWLNELYGNSSEPKTTPKFIHAEKKAPIKSSKTVDADLSRILEDVLEEKKPQD